MWVLLILVYNAGVWQGFHISRLSTLGSACDRNISYGQTQKCLNPIITAYPAAVLQHSPTLWDMTGYKYHGRMVGSIQMLPWGIYYILSDDWSHDDWSHEAALTVISMHTVVEQILMSTSKYYNGY